MAKRSPTGKSSRPRRGGKTAPKPSVEAVAPAPASLAIDVGRSLVDAFLTNERINQLLLELVDPGIWRTFPPCSKRRNIATTFAHVHNVRCMRLKMSDRVVEPPERLDREVITRRDAAEALASSARAMAALIARSFDAGGRVHNFSPDVVGLLASSIVHEAHHRGQICHWARELGKPIGPDDQLRLWEWDKRWRDVAGPGPPRS